MQHQRFILVTEMVMEVVENRGVISTVPVVAPIAIPMMVMVRYSSMSITNYNHTGKSCKNNSWRRLQQRAKVHYIPREEFSPLNKSPTGTCVFCSDHWHLSLKEKNKLKS